MRMKDIRNVSVVIKDGKVFSERSEVWQVR